MKECEQHSGSLISNEKSASCLSLQIKFSLGAEAMALNKQWMAHIAMLFVGTSFGGRGDRRRSSVPALRRV